MTQAQQNTIEKQLENLNKINKAIQLIREIAQDWDWPVEDITATLREMTIRRIKEELENNIQ